jgi:hypothetical protein
MRVLLFALMLFWLGSPSRLTFAQAKADSKIYLIGNSLTADTLPALLDGQVQWHIDCGKNLQFIHDHPEKPCDKNSTVWTSALRETQFDFLVVQPHQGTTLSQDVAVISEWLSLQPKANLIIHTGWERHAGLEAVFHKTLQGPADDDMRMTHSPGYFELLQKRLQEKFPDRKIKSTRAVQVLDAIYHDIQAKRAPLPELKELYRDDLHMQVHAGRYLMHNVLRRALGQPISERGFQLEDDMRGFLNGKLP